MRECQSGLPLAGSDATKLPPPSPANSSLPAVASRPGAAAAQFPGTGCRHAILPVLGSIAVR